MFEKTKTMSAKLTTKKEIERMLLLQWKLANFRQHPSPGSPVRGRFIDRASCHPERGRDGHLLVFTGALKLCFYIKPT